VFSFRRHAPAASPVTGPDAGRSLAG
jgi:hypothetical protein